uniref:G-protein coupled receptors family 1 profile domain-containing protein n=1 Tax=Romanomermis culicivorax TaxID=13658 RepID=A0A915IG91_ROMCU
MNSESSSEILEESLTTSDSYLKSFQIFYTPLHTPLVVAICVFGTLCNSANICVLTRRNMKNSPTNVLLTGLSVAQLLLVINFLFYTLFLKLDENECVFWTKKFTAVVYLFLNVNLNVILHTIALVHTAALAFFRFLAIRFPSQSTWFSVSRAEITRSATYLTVPIACASFYFNSVIREYTVSMGNCSLTGKNDTNDKMKNIETITRKKTQEQDAARHFLLRKNCECNGTYFFGCRGVYRFKTPNDHLYLPFRRNGTGRQQLNKLQPNGTKISLSFDYFPSIEFRSVPSEKASTNESYEIQETVELASQNITAYHIRYTSNTFLLTFNSWFFSTVCKLLPCACLIVLSVLLLYELRKLRKRRQKFRRRVSYPAENSRDKSDQNLSTFNAHHQSQRDSTHNRVTVTLIIVVLLFVLVEAPQGVTYLLIGLKFNMKEIHGAFGDLFDVLTVFYSSVNFVIYCCMSGEFRKTFRETFCSKNSRNSATSNYFHNGRKNCENPKILVAMVPRSGYKSLSPA